MARINIDDDIESKPQFWRLLPLVGGDRDAALGKLVRLFRMAQAYYGREEGIPGAELEAEELDCMIDAGWVEPIDHLAVAGKSISELEFMVPSPEKHFAWHLQRKQAAKIGGRARGNAPRDEMGRYLPKDQKTPSEPQPDAGESQPTSTPHAHAHAQKNTRTEYDFESLYRAYPQRTGLSSGKGKGLEKCRKTIKTQEEYELLKRAIATYRAEVIKLGTKPEFIKMFSSFMGCWRDYLDVSSAPKLSAFARSQQEGDDEA